MEHDTIAEVLIDLADVIMEDRNKVDLYEQCEFMGTDVNTALARAKLALVFVKRTKGMQLCAIMNEWDVQRIVRELY